MAINTAQRLPAQITRFGKVKESQYPPYERVQSVLFTCQTDEGEKTLWKTFPAEDARLLNVGQPASLYNRASLGDRPLWDVEFTTAPQPVAKPQLVTRSTPPVTFQPEPPAPAPVTDSPVAQEPMEIHDWIDDKAELYAYCLGAVTQALTAYPVGEETLHAAASTLFISASRKFKLDWA